MELNIDDLGVVGIVVEDWDVTKEFKPKTLTTDYSSWITYISRRAVPANTPITDEYYWKPIARLQKDLAFEYILFKYGIEQKIKNLSMLVESFLKSIGAGTALANEFGDSTEIAINQKTITNGFRKLWLKIGDMTGEDVTDGVYSLRLSVVPRYYLGENGCKLNIIAATEGLDTVFEHIEFYVNNKLILSREDTDYVEYEYEINKTSTIKCVATILGETYIQKRTVTHYSSFWIGAGNSYNNIMKYKNLVSLDNGWRIAHDVNVDEGQHIIIILGESLREGFIRADINGIEIEFDEERVAINGDYYAVFTSKNTYSTGIYNIDING